MITGLDTYWLLSDRSSANPDWSLLPSTMSAKLILLVCVTSGYLDISGVLKGPVGPNTPPGPYICSLLSRGDRRLLERELLRFDPAVQAMLEQLWTLVDADESGAVDPDELQKLIEDVLQVECTPEKAEDIFKEYDKFVSNCRNKIF